MKSFFSFKVFLLCITLVTTTAHATIIEGSFHGTVTRSQNNSNPSDTLGFWDHVIDLPFVNTLGFCQTTANCGSSCIENEQNICIQKRTLI